MGKDIFMYVLSVIVVACAISLVCLLVFKAIPAENHDAFMLITGNVLTWGGVVVGYWFGSSKSSADKTELLKKVGP